MYSLIFSGTYEFIAMYSLIFQALADQYSINRYSTYSYGISPIEVIFNSIRPVEKVILSIYRKQINFDGAQL